MKNLKLFCNTLPWLELGTFMNWCCSNGDGRGVVVGKSERDGTCSNGLLVVPWGCTKLMSKSSPSEASTTMFCGGWGLVWGISG